MKLVRAKKILKELNKGYLQGKHMTEPKTFGYLMGMYDSRILGFCIDRRHKVGTI